MEEKIVVIKSLSVEEKLEEVLKQGLEKSLSPMNQLILDEFYKAVKEALLLSFDASHYADSERILHESFDPGTEVKVNTGFTLFNNQLLENIGPAALGIVENMSASDLHAKIKELSSLLSELWLHHAQDCFKKIAAASYGADTMIMSNAFHSLCLTKNPHLQSDNLSSDVVMNFVLTAHEILSRACNFSNQINSAGERSIW